MVFVLLLFVDVFDCPLMLRAWLCLLYNGSGQVYRYRTRTPCH